ncbi:transcriptional regulator [Kitasatospora phosalacinea]|uniref:Transcriptional regulator n=1 Tax=Kitasatospora phosalacinea TaxID=2065 RepID=A0A9W6QEE4_9ACTN|nr:helix-turn-helix domain-containing protein [Kitasatospora phosalacinea]GLW74624.1 transcriptional regulator [Kitasatospora phosalacinea]
MADAPGPRTGWTFLTQHARVLLMVSRDPQVRVRDVARACEVTERAVQGILTDLEDTGYLTRTRNGRRNHYRVARHTFFRHPAESRHEIAGLLALFADLDSATGTDGPLPGGDHEHREHP